MPSKKKGIDERIAALDKSDELTVQFAELEIEPTQLKVYLAILKEKM